MARDWEQTFSGWTGPASNAEQARYERTRDRIREALAPYTGLAPYDFEVYAKGSYPNYTNVIRDSDVDIAAELTEMTRWQFAHAASGMTMEDFGIERYHGDYSLRAFKDDVERALRAFFPTGTVSRGSKAIHIQASGEALDADVVPCQSHRQMFTRDGKRRQGILLLDESNPGRQLVNYPKQHLEQGTKKNDATNRRYKRVVRILKRLENEMVDAGVIGAVPSFLIESCVWNVPDHVFTRNDTWCDRVRDSLIHIYQGTKTDDCVSSDDWFEANRVKYLFFGAQAWTCADANQFAKKAWNYVGFS